MANQSPSEEQRLIDLLEQVGHLTSTLSHDLRSPLHLVAGYADLLSAQSFGPLTAKQKEFVELIRMGAKRIEEQIDHSQERINALIKTAPTPGTKPGVKQ